MPSDSSAINGIRVSCTKVFSVSSYLTAERAVVFSGEVKIESS